MQALNTVNKLQVINSFGWYNDTVKNSSITAKHLYLILTFRSHHEIFIKRSWYSVLQSLDATISTSHQERSQRTASPKQVRTHRPCESSQSHSRLEKDYGHRQRTRPSYQVNQGRKLYISVRKVIEL